jgi:hypothetical protein
MIDWWFVVRHAVWIIGASIVVASWSFQRTLVSRYAFGGAAMFCVGMATVSRWWEAILWLALPIVLRWKTRN